MKQKMMWTKHYTMTIKEMVENFNFNLNEYDFTFYCENSQIRENFCKKFINHYYFYEIGFDTAGEFVHYLITKLNEIMPLYEQYYQAELRCKDIDFMLNKDLVETIVREGEQNSEASTNDESIAKQSNIEQGNASLGLEEGYLTNVANQNVKASSEGSSKTKDSTTLISKGNIGVTSSAQLLQMWYDVMINIDQMIIDECNDLFLKVY